MTETIASRLTRSTQDPAVYGVDMLLKCKTRDGMIYTLDVSEYRREECPKGYEFAEWVENAERVALINATELIADKDGFWYSEQEMASIKHGEITRLWVDIDAFYRSDGPVVDERG